MRLTRPGAEEGKRCQEKGVRYLFFAHTIGRWRAEPDEAFGHWARRGMAVASLRNLTLRPLTFKEGLTLPRTFGGTAGVLC